MWRHMASDKKTQPMNTSMLDDTKRCPHVFNSCRHSENNQEIMMPQLKMDFKNIENAETCKI